MCLVDQSPLGPSGRLSENVFRLHRGLRVGAYHQAPDLRCIWRIEPSKNQRGPMDQPTFSAMPAPAPMSLPQPELKEVHQRQCPACNGLQVVHAGHAIAGEGRIKEKQRCEGCGTAFWFVRDRTPSALAAAGDNARPGSPGLLSA